MGSKVQRPESNVQSCTRLYSKSKIAAQVTCAAFFLLQACTTTTPSTAPLRSGDGVVHHHVIIFAGTDWGETGLDVDDASSRNAVWLQTTRLHATAQAFTNQGGTTVLYQQGTQPPDEAPAAFPIAPATGLNLKNALETLASKMDTDDHLTIHLSVHGLRTGNIHTDGEEIFTPRALEEMLAPIPARQRLLILDACFAGNFLHSPHLHGSKIGTSPKNKYGWIERDFSFAQFFFSTCQTPSDPNIRHAAFAEAATRFKEAGTTRLPFIKNQYGGKGLKEEAVNDLSFEAIYIPEE